MEEVRMAGILTGIWAGDFLVRSRNCHRYTATWTV